MIGRRSVAGVALSLAAAALIATAIGPSTSPETNMSGRAASKPDRNAAIEYLLAGRFQWKTGPPLVAPASRPSDPCHAIKDPTIVRYRGKWHLFHSIRSAERSHQIEYLSFADWKDADKSPRHVLKITDGYFCAPQVFYFAPHKKWYLLYQAFAQGRKPGLQPAFSTTTTIADPASWTKPVLLFKRSPPVKMWIDFWIICDARNAHLFFTSLDGKMWRCEAPLAKFPHGWSWPELALSGDIFEASHTYRLKGTGKFLTIIEAQAGRRRYFKAYLADSLDGEWAPLAASRNKPFASRANVIDSGPRWTDSVSHGELIRAGHDEKLLVDPADLRFLFQGVLAKDMKGRKYGEIRWRLGMLEPVR